MLCTKRGDIVLDPFMGSGSTGIAAVLSNRHFIGCERDKNVYDSAVNWFNNYNHAEAENYVKRIRSNETVPR
jgi:DNA modification methylase